MNKQTGWLTGAINLPAIGIDIELKPHQRYRCLGCVNHIEKAGLDADGMPIEISDAPDMEKNITGRCELSYRDGIYYVQIKYVKSKNPLVSLARRGHEEGEAARLLGGRDYLEEKARSFGLNPGFYFFDDFADLGKAVALLKEDVSPEDVLKLTEEINLRPVIAKLLEEIIG